MQPFIEALEQVYGKRSNSGFGSAVFYEASKLPGSLASMALDVYKFFMGNKWNNETEAAWLSGWKQVYERSPGTVPDILSELKNIKDEDAKRSVPLLTELIENAEQGRHALESAFNYSGISHAAVFTVGDSAAFSGLILSGIYADHSVCSVICLMD